MTDNFINEIMKTGVAALCHTMGWNSAQTATIDILADLWRRQFLHISKKATRNAEHCGRTHVTLEDTMLVFSDMGTSMSELEEYIHNFDPVPLPYKVPNFPRPKENHLNFLRPGSAEVLTRPVHIHEYMPPWTIPTPEEKEKEKKESQPRTPSESSSGEREVNGIGGGQQEKVLEKEKDKENEITEVLMMPEESDKENLENGNELSDSEKTKDETPKEMDISESPPTPPPSSSGANSFGSTPPKSAKRMESPGESPALKRVRLMLEEEGHTQRQISSVIMTTSGFLTSSREGRLPDTRPPVNRDFFELIPAPPAEKKKKIPTMKKIVEGVKRIDKDKENENAPFDLFEKPDKIVTVSREDGGKVKDRESSSGKRRDKESKKLSSSNRREKERKERQKLESRHKLAERKFSKLPDKDLKKKLNIFKKNLLSSDKIAKKARRLKLKKQKQRQMEEEEEEEEEEGLDIISSDENFDDEVVAEPEDVKPDIEKITLKKHRHKSKEGSTERQHLTIKKIKKEKSPLVLPLPKSSSKFRDIPLGLKVAMAATSGGPMGELLGKKKRGRPKKILPGALPPIPTLTHGGSPLKIAKISKRMHQAFGRDINPLIPEVSITKPPPPPENFPMNFRLPMQPGLIPVSFAPPPALRKSQNLLPSISITPATPTISGLSPPILSKDSRGSQLPLPASVCSSVTITRIDMSNSQKLPTPYDNSPTPPISNQMTISITPQGQKSSSNSSSSGSNITIQADANSGITITPIVMDKKGVLDMGMSPVHIPPERERSSMLAKLDEDIRMKEEKKERRKDREKRKEMKKEKKKERKEKERGKSTSVKLEKGDKKEKKEKDKDREKKKKSGDSLQVPQEGLVPKITLKLHSNTNTPVDSPNPPQRMLDDRMNTPPPTRKITIKPVEEFVKKRTPSPELARFSPLVTRPPKSSKVSLPTKSPPIPHAASTSFGDVVSFPPSAPGSKRGPGRPPKSSGTGTSRGPGRPPKSSQAGLITETVGFYIDDQGTKVWICPSCGRQDDGSPMIGCDTCDDWYHFTCVGITDTPDETESWYCKRCRKNAGSTEHRKKGPKL